MLRAGTQPKLFDTTVHLDNGLVYRPNFITPEEEELLLIFCEEQDLSHGRGGPNREYEAQRRMKHFGWDFEESTLIPGPPLPRFLQTFAHRIEKWLDLSRGRVVEALINEYSPGAALGWHTDREGFEHIVGISIGSWAKMRFRPLRPRGTYDPKEVIALELEPRSAYVMQGAVRWHWQHSVAATRALRYSLTFRTLPSGMPATYTRAGKRV